jgi:phage-related protein
MTIPTFAPYKDPIIGTKQQVQFRVLDAGFGDGYSQVTPDGLNTKMIGVQGVQWVGMTLSQAHSISTQLDSFNGTTFAYQLPGTSAPIYWRCKSYSLDDSDGFYLSISADLQQVFDLS